MSFKRLGQIRKGKPQNGSSIPGNLNHRFRISFDEVLPGAEAKLNGFYTQMGMDLHHLKDGEFIVTELPVIIPLESAFDFSVQANLRLPVCRSDGEAEYWKFIRHPTTLEMLVSDGVVRVEHTDPQGNLWQIGEKRKVIQHEPVVVYDNKDGESTKVTPKTKAILSVMLPYLGEWGEFEIVTTSSNGARKLRGEFDDIVKIAQKANVDIIQVPVILKRELKEITKQWGVGKAKRAEEWLWVLEVEKNWFNEHLLKMKAGWMTEEITEVEIEAEEPTTNPKPPPTVKAVSEITKGATHEELMEPVTEKTKPVATSARPYNPATLKQKFVKAIAAYKGDAPSFQVVAKHLGDIFPDKVDRYAFTRWAFGSGSTKDLTTPQRFAVGVWFVKGIPVFESVVNEHCKQEAQAALAEAMKAEGQKELL